MILIPHPIVKQILKEKNRTRKEKTNKKVNTNWQIIIRETIITSLHVFLCIDALCWYLFICHVKEQRETRKSLSIFIQQYV